ncbi:MAG: hypothetical protein KC656_27870, partial [Myxococcales bacterium]|nr:hypothetical protein [Myxococcales bacterium]
MLTLRTITLGAALTLSAPALARPVVWSSVPDSDFALQGVELAFPTAHERLDVRHAALDAARDEVDASRDALAEARRTRVSKLTDQFAARVDLWQARRAD